MVEWLLLKSSSLITCLFASFVVVVLARGISLRMSRVSTQENHNYSTQLNCSASDMEDSLIYPNPCTSSIYNHPITSITSTLPSTRPNFFPHHWISQTSWAPLDILRYWPLREGWRVKNIPSVVPINHSCIGLMFHYVSLLYVEPWVNLHRPAAYWI